MKILFLITMLFSLSAQANTFICQLEDSSASTLRLDYSNNSPQAVYLKSPGSDEYRPLDLNIKPVIGSPQDDLELLSVQPKDIENLDWSQIPECYIEIGTQWLFTFHHKSNSYKVQFMPYFQKKSTACVEPKFKAQSHKLNCTWDNQLI